MNSLLQNNTAESVQKPSIPCRLCGADAIFKFELRLLRTREVNYYECLACDSLQTENPTWLDQAYSENLASADTGAAQRTLRNLVVTYCLSKVTRSKHLLDIGGGDGLLCRFLRDYGLNAFVQDKYSRPIYAQNFTQPNFSTPDLVMAFEVIEHFANPEQNLADLFAKDAQFYLFSTGIYNGESKDWWYLTPNTGQHIFFYSKNSLEIIARKHHLSCLIQGNLIFLYKGHSLSRLKLLIIRLLMRREITWLLRAIVVLLPAKGVQQDHLFDECPIEGSSYGKSTPVKKVK